MTEGDLHVESDLEDRLILPDLWMQTGGEGEVRGELGASGLMEQLDHPARAGDVGTCAEGVGQRCPGRAVVNAGDLGGVEHLLDQVELSAGETGAHLVRQGAPGAVGRVAGSELLQRGLDPRSALADEDLVDATERRRELLLCLQAFELADRAPDLGCLARTAGQTHGPRERVLDTALGRLELGGPQGERGVVLAIERQHALDVVARARDVADRLEDLRAQQEEVG